MDKCGSCITLYSTAIRWTNRVSVAVATGSSTSRNCDLVTGFENPFPPLAKIRIFVDSVRLAPPRQRLSAQRELSIVVMVAELPLRRTGELFLCLTFLTHVDLKYPRLSPCWCST